MLQCTALSCLNWGGMALKLPVPTVALSQLSVDNYNVAFRLHLTSFRILLNNLQLQLQLFAGKALPFQAFGIFKNSTVARMTEWEGTLLGLPHAQRDEFTGFPCLHALASPF